MPWSTKPAWACFRSREVFGGDGPLLSLSAQHGIRQRLEGEGRAASTDTSGYRQVCPGDIVINRLIAKDGAIALADAGGIISPAYWVLIANSDLDPRYLNYLINSSPYLAEIGRRSKSMPPAQFDLPWNQFRTIPIPQPAMTQQQTIADYLDRETARIDALVAKKQQLIELLVERDREATEELVLGLGESRTVPSRTGFFQAVPRSWDETALRHIVCEVQTGPFGSQLHQDEYSKGGWPVVNPSNLKDGGIVAINTMTVDDGKRLELARHILRPGDIVFGRRGEMGRAGLVGEVHAGWLCGTGSLRLRVTDDRLKAPFLKLLLETEALRRYFETLSVGSTMDNLNSEILRGLPCLLPPPTVQAEIVVAVENSRQSCVELVARMAQEVALWEERRQALITAAVTGELEVAA